MLEGRDLAKRIETSYLRRLEGFPEDARRLLLVAAAEPVGDPLLVRGACERLGISPSAVDATEGLLTLAGTRDLPASPGALGRLPVGQWAGASSDPLGVGRGHGPRPSIPTGAPGTWPLPRPDRTRTSRASSSSRRAGRRRAAAARPRLRSCNGRWPLTGDPERRAERALAAAQASLGAGAFDVARGLLSVADAGPLDELGRARVVLLRAEIAFAQNRGGDAPLLLLQAARRLEALDVRLCRNTYLDAWGAALFAGHLAAPGGGLLDVSRAVAAAPEPTDGRAGPRPAARRPRADLHRGHAHGGARAASARSLRSRAARPPWTRCCGGVGWRRGRRSGCGTTTADSRSRGARCSSRATRERSRSSPWRTTCAVRPPRGAATSNSPTLMVAEVDAVKEATESRIAPYAAISLAGLRGREAEASELIDGRRRGSLRQRPGHRRPVRALGERRADERPRPLRGGPGGGRGGHPGTRRSCSSPHGRWPS